MKTYPLTLEPLAINPLASYARVQRSITVLAMVLVSLIALLSTSNIAMARQSDRSQPINVNADSSEFDEKAGVQSLQGNVQITQGTLQINADFIAITLENNALSKIEGRGSPIRFEQENEAGELMQGQAREIIYNAVDGTLILVGDASLSQPRQSLTSERITFNGQTQKVSADGGERSSGGGGRVSIQIQPPSNSR